MNTKYQLFGRLIDYYEY